MFFNLEKLKAGTLKHFLLMPEVIQRRKASQKYSRNRQNYLLGLWFDYVTHAVLHGESRLKNNHIDCFLKGKNMKNLMVATDR